MAKLAEKIEVIVEEPETKVDTTVEDPEAKVDTSVALDVPEGGIGGFAMSEEDFEILEAEEAKKEFGESGLAQFTAVAKKMAGHGRYGDDSVAHIQTGEIVVPLTLIESNPALKEQIFKQLRESGIEDPEQYVVGNPANNINPETGLMEFGFFSSLWKGIKKIVKGVVKIIKKVAPIVLPIVLAMTGLGPIYGAAMGSGIGTLINGGSIKDALKSALISGATGAVFQGFAGPAEGPGAFMENVKAGFADPLGRASATWEGAKSTFTGGGFTGEGNLFSKYVPTTSAEIPNAQTLTEAGVEVADTSVVNTGGEVAADGSVITGSEGTPVTGGTTLTPEAPVDTRNFLEKTSDFMTQGNMTDAEVALAKQNGGLEAVALAKSQGVTDPTRLSAIAEAGAKAAGPGMLAKFGPSALAGTAIAAGAGFFDVPEQEMPGLVDRNEDGTVITGSDLIAADPAKYLVQDLGATRLNPDTGEYEAFEDQFTIAAPDTSMYTVPTDYPMSQSVISPNGYLMASNPGGPFARPYVQGAADGGPIYPRRNGGVAPSEGVQGQDSVRAMLMPGEFVMTTDAVRGLGNGNLNNGIKSMYSVMRNLESRGRATA